MEMTVTRDIILNEIFRLTDAVSYEFIYDTMDINRKKTEKQLKRLYGNREVSLESNWERFLIRRGCGEKDFKVADMSVLWTFTNFYGLKFIEDLKKKKSYDTFNIFTNDKLYHLVYLGNDTDAATTTIRRHVAYMQEQKEYMEVDEKDAVDFHRWIFIFGSFEAASMVKIPKILKKMAVVIEYPDGDYTKKPTITRYEKEKNANG